MIRYHASISNAKGARIAVFLRNKNRPTVQPVGRKKLARQHQVQQLAYGGRRAGNGVPIGERNGLDRCISPARGARCCAVRKLFEDELYPVKWNFQRGRLCNRLLSVGIKLVLSIRGRAEVGQSGADILYGVRYGMGLRHRVRIDETLQFFDG